MKVTDDMAENVCKIWLGEYEWKNYVWDGADRKGQIRRMKAAIESVLGDLPEVMVPEKLEPEDAHFLAAAAKDNESKWIAFGWNACREAMLSAAPMPPRGE